MKSTLIKLLLLVMLSAQLIAPAQAVVMELDKTPGSDSGHCMQQMKSQGDVQAHGGDCCQQDNTSCDMNNCHKCQTCGSVAMLISLHRQTTSPVPPGTSLVYTAEYLQSITPQNLYRPPIHSTL